MATFPDTGFVKVSITRIRKQSSLTAFNLDVYVQDYLARRWKLSASLPPIKANDPIALTWRNFFKDLDGMKNTFTMDITSYVLNEPTLTAVSFRQISPNDSWSIDEDGFFFFNNFEATSQTNE